MAEAEHKALMAQLTDLAVLRESNTALRCVHLPIPYLQRCSFIHVRRMFRSYIRSCTQSLLSLPKQRRTLSVMPSGRLQGPLLRDACPHATAGE